MARVGNRRHSCGEGPCPQIVFPSLWERVFRQVHEWAGYMTRAPSSNLASEIACWRSPLWWRTCVRRSGAAIGGTAGRIGGGSPSSVRVTTRRIGRLWGVSPLSRGGAPLPGGAPRFRPPPPWFRRVHTGAEMLFGFNFGEFLNTSTGNWAHTGKILDFLPNLPKMANRAGVLQLFCIL